MSAALSAWGGYALAAAVFFLSHAIPARPQVRAWLIGRLGMSAYLLAYVAVSLAVLGWLIAQAGRAPHVTLWSFAPWQTWVPNLAMPLVCVLAAYGVATPNPLSFGGAGNARFDPARPGIAGVARHPILWALALWSGAHLVPNGDLAHVLLFGTFAGFALLGMTMLDRRGRRRMGAAAWERLAARTSGWPFAALLDGRWRPRGGPEPLRLAHAVFAWAGLLALHPPVIGVSPLPL